MNMIDLYTVFSNSKTMKPYEYKYNVNIDCLAAILNVNAFFFMHQKMFRLHAFRGKYFTMSEIGKHRTTMTFMLNGYNEYEHLQEFVEKYQTI